MRSVIERNPFAARTGLEPAKFTVVFLAREPDPEAREKVLAIRADPEELKMNGQELYIYFPEGMGRSKLSMALIERTLKVPITARNWNSVTKLHEIAGSFTPAV